MHTILNSRLMIALESLRHQGHYHFPCTVLFGGKSTPALLGPRVDGHSVRLLVDGKKAEAEFGLVSVCGETAEALETEAQRLTISAVAARMMNRGAKAGTFGYCAGRGYGK